RLFHGKDAILSGPAGGIVGAVSTAAMAGFDKIIGFDMGGTSTDVSHYAGEFERRFETVVAGVRLRAPMLSINTVAAGGGSICSFDGAKYRVGPESAGALPGPACYGNGGPLTVTDCNVMIGKLQPRFFPRVFGRSGDEPLDGAVVAEKFAALAAEISAATGDTREPAAVAAGFIEIAVQNMANAIKQISIERGHDVTQYTLACFGGAGGQHACLVADALGMKRIYIHPLAGVLSAYGMGLADLRTVKERAVEAPLSAALMPALEAQLAQLADEGASEMRAQGIDPRRISVEKRAHVKYDGTDAPLPIAFATHDEIASSFAAAHRQRYGFVMAEKPLIVEAVSAETVGATDVADDPVFEVADHPGDPAPIATVELFLEGRRRAAPVYDRDGLDPGVTVAGPAIIIEATATTFVEPGWRARIDRRRYLVLERAEARRARAAIGTSVDPVMLEVFNNLFMAIAEQMGVALQNTAYSVNIKERLDFSCALFDRTGSLIANAPHLPVHLGSMGESVRTIIRSRARSADGRGMKRGDVYVLNAPYNGGTHLPDVTVIMPVFPEASEGPVQFYVASRGHQADIGGTTPGSMPPDSTSVEEEGVLIDDFLLVDAGRLREDETVALLQSGRYPSRNAAQNLADLKAQIAACAKGAEELHGMARHFGKDVVEAYMRHVQDNAAEQVRRALDRLKDGSFAYAMDDGGVVRVKVAIDRAARRATIDFSGTSAQRPTNFNAPTAVCMAAVLYVFRTLVDDDIPLNGGCLEPLDIVIPPGSMLSPRYPAAVVGGNVETSQCITDALYGALGVMAGAQGTMNNFTFGNAR
ncbi:MAG TPA: hydantoinase B/oxoprolinase family protein, partial [Stellaceae bacterium]|nr:hydantoinase B/oxoprolinase family protein [Stellaceae bacterium]